MKLFLIIIIVYLAPGNPGHSQDLSPGPGKPGRERIPINQGWKFFRYGPAIKADDLIYDLRPEIRENRDDRPADARPTDAVGLTDTGTGLKPWILPTGNS